MPTKLGTQIRTNSSLDEIPWYVHIFPEPWTKLKLFGLVKSSHIVLVQGIKKRCCCWIPLSTVGWLWGVCPAWLPLTTSPLEAWVLGHLGVEVWLIQHSKEWRWDGCSIFSMQDLTDLFLWGWFFPTSPWGWSPRHPGYLAVLQLGTASQRPTGTAHWNAHPSPSFVNPDRGAYELGSEDCPDSCFSLKYFQKFGGKNDLCFTGYLTNEIR